MATRHYLDRHGRPRLYVSPDEFVRARSRARRLSLRMREVCERAELPPTAFRRWSSSASAPAPEAWRRLLAALGAAEAVRE